MTIKYQQTLMLSCGLLGSFNGCALPPDGITWYIIDEHWFSDVLLSVTSLKKVVAERWRKILINQVTSVRIIIHANLMSIADIRMDQSICQSLDR